MVPLLRTLVDSGILVNWFSRQEKLTDLSPNWFLRVKCIKYGGCSKIHWTQPCFITFHVLEIVLCFCIFMSWVYYCRSQLLPSVEIYKSLQGLHNRCVRLWVPSLKVDTLSWLFGICNSFLVFPSLLYFFQLLLILLVHLPLELLPSHVLSHHYTCKMNKLWF